MCQLVLFAISTWTSAAFKCILHMMYSKWSDFGGRWSHLFAETGWLCPMIVIGEKNSPTKRTKQVTWHIHFFPICDGKKYGQITSAWQFMPITHSIASRRRSQSQVLHERERKPLGGECRRVSLSVCVCVWLVSVWNSWSDKWKLFRIHLYLQSYKIRLLLQYAEDIYLYLHTYIHMYIYIYRCRFNWLRTQNPFFCVM